MVKAKIFLFIVFATSFLTGFAQQVPNGGFENFTTPFEPAGWSSLEDILQNIIDVQNSIFTFKDTTTYTQGHASLKLFTDTVPGYGSTFGKQAGLISLGTESLNSVTGQISFTGIGFTYRPDSFIFDYKLTSPGIDTGIFNCVLTKQTVKIMQAANYLMLDSDWVHMAIPLAPLYLNNNIPDTLLIQFGCNFDTNRIIGTTLHIDGVRFGYINPTIPAIVTALGINTFCLGGSVTLQANTGTGYTYQWRNNGNNITGATGSSFTADSTGSYSVKIDSAGTVAYSVPEIVTVNYPQAALPGLNDTICSNAAAFTLGGTPLGGTYTGSGVTGLTFTPGTAPLGLDTIKYTVTDDNNCAGTAVATALVENCAGINTVSANSIAVYPDPVINILNINSDVDLDGFSLQIFDMIGRLVTCQTLTGTNNSVGVAKLADGTYVYRITDCGNNTVVQNKFTVIK